MAKKNPVNELFDMAGNFVTQQKGKWEHKDWEAFLEKVQRAGVQLTDDLKKSLGHALEAGKHFYSSVSSVPEKAPKEVKIKVKSAGKPKAKSKAKPKTKAKAKS